MRGLLYAYLIVAISAVAGCGAQPEEVPQPGPQVVVKMSCDAPFEVMSWASAADRCSGFYILSDYSTVHLKMFEHAYLGGGGSFVNLNLDRSFELVDSAGGQLLQVSFKREEVMSPGEILVRAHADHAIIEFGGKRCRFPYNRGEPGIRVVYDWSQSPHVPKGE